VPPPGQQETNTFSTTEPARFLAAAECTLDDFYIFDGIPDSSGAIVDFRFSYINPNAERRLGVPRETLYGKALTEVRPFMIQSGLIHKYREVVRTGTPYVSEVFIDDEMIKGTWLNIQVVRLGNGIAITSRDVTEHRRRSDHVNYLAYHDHLTGSPIVRCSTSVSDKQSSAGKTTAKELRFSSLTSTTLNRSTIGLATQA
jgi:hypothetical protein